MNPNKTIVFDIDDTILVTKNRDYKNSEPINDVIEGIKFLKKHGWKIIFHTARGMGRSGGNIDLVANEVRQEIENFCYKYEVPFDELILGKVWAFAYVDDKGMRPEEFAKNYKKFI